MKRGAVMTQKDPFFKKLWKNMRSHPLLYIMILPVLAYFLVYHYYPMYGMIISLFDYVPTKGVFGSDFVGLKHFKAFLGDPYFFRTMRNTVSINLLLLLFGFPFPIIFAILLNELTGTRLRKITQTITYMPHFLSWVVVGAFVYQMLSPSSGIVNAVLIRLGILDKPVFFMVQQNMFVPIYLLTNLWKSTGYSIVIYLATISGIDPQLYDSAAIDGANRLHKVLYITLPALFPTMCTLLILNVGSLISVGFDPIFNLYNDATYPVADVISTYVYRKGMVDSQYDLSTAVGLFQNVISLVLVLGANWFARKANPDYRII